MKFSFQIWQSSTFRFAGIGLRPGENLLGAEKQKKKNTEMKFLMVLGWC